MELKKLNLLMDYSVKWSIENVINNFVQNFYDAVGPEIPWKTPKNHRISLVKIFGV